MLWNASTEHSTTSGKSQDFPLAQQNPESDNVSALSQSNPLSSDKGTQNPEQSKAEQSKNLNDGDPKPIGKGLFGNIYDQFKGKVKEAFDFLVRRKEGDLLGVFHRDDIGDIDLVWGDRKENKGLDHIIDKHIEQHNDFASIDEAMSIIEDIVNNGSAIKENNDKMTIEKDGKRVVILKNERDSDGNVLSNKNWVVTAFDNTRSKKEKAIPATTLSTPNSNKESRDVALDTTSSEDKGTQNPEQSKAEPVKDEELPHTEATVGEGEAADGNQSITESEALPDNTPSGTVSEEIKQKYKESKKIYGRNVKVRLPDDSKRAGRYVIVEAGDVTTSHSPFTFGPMVGFPTTANGKTINDRDYEKDKDAQVIVERIAQKYNDKAVKDYPIISKDGIVLSGNNRSMSGVIAAKNNTDGDYLEQLYEDADMYGFNQEEVQQAFKHPRLVFEMDEALPYTTDTMAMFNDSDKKSMNRVEKAVKYGKPMSLGVANSIGTLLNEYETLSDFYSDKKGVSELIRLLLANNMIGQNDIAEWKDGNSLSSLGKDQLEAMMIGNVLEEDSIRVLNEEGMKQYRAKIVKTILPLVENKGFKADFSLYQELNEAIQVLNDKKSNNFGTVKETVSNSAELFEEKGYSEDAIAIANKLDSGKQKDIRDFFLIYNEEAKLSNSGQASMFSGKVKTKKEILNEAHGRTEQDVEGDRGVHGDTTSQKTELAGADGILGNSDRSTNREDDKEDVERSELRGGLDTDNGILQSENTLNDGSADLFAGEIRQGGHGAEASGEGSTGTSGRNPQDE